MLLTHMEFEMVSGDFRALVSDFRDDNVDANNIVICIHVHIFRTHTPSSRQQRVSHHHLLRACVSHSTHECPLAAKRKACLQQHAAVHIPFSTTETRIRMHIISWPANIGECDRNIYRNAHKNIIIVVAVVVIISSPVRTYAHAMTTTRRSCCTVKAKQTPFALGIASYCSSIQNPKPFRIAGLCAR